MGGNSKLIISEFSGKHIYDDIRANYKEVSDVKEALGMVKAKMGNANVAYTILHDMLDIKMLNLEKSLKTIYRKS